MIDSKEIMQQVLDCEIGDRDDIKANIFYRTNLGEIEKCMIEYAKKVAIDFLDSIRNYEIDVQGRDPLNSSISNKEYYAIYSEFE